MNKVKSYTLWGTIIVLVLGTLSHFVYEWTGKNQLAAAFFPINESTWEHMKLLFFPMLLYVLIAAFPLKEKYPNILPASFCGILLGIFLIPVLFYTYSGILGFHLAPIDMGIFAVSVIAAFLLTHRLSSSRKRLPQGLRLPVTAAIILFFAAFVIFSFYTPALGIFADPTGS